MAEQESTPNIDRHHHNALDAFSNARERLRKLKEEVPPPSDKPDFRHVKIANCVQELLSSSGADWKALAEFLTTDILPEKNFANIGPQTSDILRYRLREVIRKWLDTLPETALSPTRNILTSWCLEQLSGATAEEAIYELMSIGYRSPEIVRALREFSVHRGKSENLAIRAISQMRPVGKDREWVDDEIRRRIALSRAADDLDDLLIASVAAEMTDRTISLLVEGADPKDKVKFWQAMGRLGWILPHRPGDLTEQERIWSAIWNLASQPGGLPNLVGSGVLFEDCHARKAVSQMVEALPKIAELGEVMLWRWLLRMQELKSPEQTEGLRELVGSPSFEVLQNIAIRDSKQVGLSSTHESTLKIDSFKTLLACGDERLFQWAELWIGNESNKYVLHKLVSELAVVPFEKLPGRVVEILRTPSKSQKGSDLSELLPYFAASQLAASSLTSKAFELLLNSDVTMEGDSFTTPVKSAVHLGMWLAEKDREIFNTVRPWLSDSRRIVGQSIAVELMCRAADRGWLEEEDAKTLLNIATDPQQQGYIRQLAISGVCAGVALLDRKRVADMLGSLIGSEDARLAVASINGLAFLKMHKAFSAEIAKYVEKGYAISGERLKAARQVDVHHAEVIGALSAVDPEVYAERFDSIVRHGFIVQAHTALQRYLWTLEEHEPRPSYIIEAILSRITSGETFESSQPYLFERLAELSPRTIFETKWPELWDRWMPDAREALAKILPTALFRTNDAHQETAIGWLKLLIGDSMFAVRRAAARSLCLINSDLLGSFCDEWIRTSSVQWRLRAAEAAAWLPADDTKRFENELIRILRRDENRCVRERADEARKELMRRVWAEAHVKIVTTQRDDPARWIVEAYGAGRALERIGDDNDLLCIQRLSTDMSLPPNITHWLEEIAKGIEDQWKQTTGKWPEPWIPCRGYIEELDGELILGEEPYSCHFTLWREPPEKPRGYWSWGVSAAVKSAHPMEVMFPALSVQSPYQLRAPGRRDAKVSPAGSSNWLIELSGTDEYPEKI